ncbi:MAG TPA: urease accessory protein UreG, partial [Moraxellaceae bacterium]|nr:urease accessory protein UreG [Moraxellaceae bacterium]
MTGFTQKNPTQAPRLSPLRLGIGGPVGSGKTALT